MSTLDSNVIFALLTLGWEILMAHFSQLLSVKFKLLQNLIVPELHIGLELVQIPEHLVYFDPMKVVCQLVVE